MNMQVYSAFPSNTFVVQRKKQTTCLCRKQLTDAEAAKKNPIRLLPKYKPIDDTYIGLTMS